MTNDEALEERIEVIRDEIEAIEHNLDILEDEIDRERRHPDRPRTHVIVENHDNGETIRFWAPDKRTIGEVVAEVYAKFRLEQHPTDRLTRVSDGTNVVGQESLTVKQYLETQPHEHTIRWALRTDAGGASRA